VRVDGKLVTLPMTNGSGERLRPHSGVTIDPSSKILRQLDAVDAVPGLAGEASVRVSSGERPLATSRSSATISRTPAAENTCAHRHRLPSLSSSRRPHGHRHRSTRPALRALGGADGLRLPGCHHARAGHLPAPDRHHGEARAASPARQRPAQRAVRLAQRRAAGVRGGVSRVLLRADLRGEAPARHRRVQPRATAPAAAGDDGRDGPQWLQEGHHRQRPRREPQPADFFAQSQLEAPHDYVVYVQGFARSGPGEPKHKSTRRGTSTPARARRR
jgi:hypothetical protein